MKKPFLKPNYQQHFDTITRSLIQLSLHSTTLNDKIIISKAAILSKKLRPYPLPHCYSQNTKNQLLNKQNLPPLCINTIDSSKFSEITHTKSQTESLVSQLKQTNSKQIQSQTQQYDQTLQKQKLFYRHSLANTYSSLDPQNSQLKKNRISTQNTTATSFSIDNPNELQIIKQINGLKQKMKQLQQQKMDRKQKQNQIQQLKNKIKSLKYQLAIVNQKKNKLKKKVSQYQAIIQGVQQEHHIFQNNYSKIISQI